MRDDSTVANVCFMGAKAAVPYLSHADSRSRKPTKSMET
jgi:hypothetical protein